MSLPADDPPRTGQVPPVPPMRPPRPGSQAGEGSSRRASGPLGDHRGLTAAGCAVLMLVLGFAGAALDALAGHDLWIMFGIGFIGATALSAARCHAEDLVAAFILPPLIYLVIALVFALISPRSGLHAGGSEFARDFGGNLVFSAPLLGAATLVALGLAIARGRASAARRQRSARGQQSELSAR